jgi:predicted DNA-binding WGR domain protein
MSAITLTRIDPSRNMARFYRLDVQPDLFGGWSLWREWGRLGSSGQVRHAPYPTAEAAETARQMVERAKRKRGYSITML